MALAHIVLLVASIALAVAVVAGIGVLLVAGAGWIVEMTALDCRRLER